MPTKHRSKAFDQPPVKLYIKLGQHGGSPQNQIILNGQDITRAVVGVEFRADARGATTASVSLDIRALEVEADISVDPFMFKRLVLKESKPSGV